MLCRFLHKYNWGHLFQCVYNLRDPSKHGSPLLWQIPRVQLGVSYVLWGVEPCFYSSVHIRTGHKDNCFGYKTFPKRWVQHFWCFNSLYLNLGHLRRNVRKWLKFINHDGSENFQVLQNFQVVYSQLFSYSENLL